MVLNGQVGFHVLGFDRVAADSVQSLQSDLAATTGGGQNNSGLDAVTLQSLLNMDPFCEKRKTVVAAIGPPLVGPPRFVPAKPAERSGVGTGAQGDVFTVVYDQTIEDKHTGALRRMNADTSNTCSDAAPTRSVSITGLRHLG
jgi:hypothetical protein